MSISRFEQITRTIGAGIIVEHAITRDGGWLHGDGFDFSYPLPPLGEGWQIAVRAPQNRLRHTLWRRIIVGRFA